jgi:hypothetical protein
LYKGRPQLIAEAKLDLPAFGEIAWMMHYQCIHELGWARRRERAMKARQGLGASLRQAGA